MDDVTKNQEGHQLKMVDRKSLSLTGVHKVQSFDPKEIVLDTLLGVLSIKGEGLGIKLLDLEHTRVEIEGQIDALIYPKNTKGSRQSFVNRIFR